METSVKERLKQFIDTLNISEREFCRRIGVSSSELLAKLLEEANNEKSRLLSIIESQQRTIESLTDLSKKANAQTVEHAGCANAV